MNCDEILILLNAYIDKELDKPTEKVVRAHLAACPACKNRHAHLLEVVEAVRALPETPMPNSLSAEILAAVQKEAEKKPRRAMRSVVFLRRPQFYTAIAACFLFLVVGLGYQKEMFDFGVPEAVPTPSFSLSGEVPEAVETPLVSPAVSPFASPKAVRPTPLPSPVPATGEAPMPQKARTNEPQIASMDVIYTPRTSLLKKQITFISPDPHAAAIYEAAEKNADAVRHAFESAGVVWEEKEEILYDYTDDYNALVFTATELAQKIAEAAESNWNDDTQKTPNPLSIDAIEAEMEEICAACEKVEVGFSQE